MQVYIDFLTELFINSLASLIRSSKHYKFIFKDFAQILYKIQENFKQIQNGKFSIKIIKWQYLPKILIFIEIFKSRGSGGSASGVPTQRRLYKLSIR